MSTAVLALSSAEWKLLMRNKTVALSATLMPLLLGLLLGTSVPGSADLQVWSATLTTQLLAVQGLTVYFTVTTALTSRREDLYLKRLRSSEQSAATILTGLLSPAVLLGFGQMIVLFGISVGLGAPLPASPVALVLAMIPGVALAVAAGAATSGRTSTAEQAQITTMPWLIVLLGSAVWASLSTSPAVVLLPGGAFGDLVHRAMSGVDLLGGLPALGVLVAWTAVLGLLARAWFRWEPRA
ncbi:ABC transporter permease [Saccharopolyspora elongata]|uniref:ABC transporter permease n=1 Tax=Saccharopolyspora elongata TaxID=2530387 RepID=A0A4R4YAB4_9PSEU|nr:ABC transporter permease [Saccharopolyspora elongata]TDD40754.1 ABC transporter permease [Saccharopolyspora elongata]